MGFRFFSVPFCALEDAIYLEASWILPQSIRHYLVFWMIWNKVCFFFKCLEACKENYLLGAQSMIGDYRVRKTHHLEPWLLHISALGPGGKHFISPSIFPLLENEDKVDVRTIWVKDIKCLVQCLEQNKHLSLNKAVWHYLPVWFKSIWTPILQTKTFKGW